jgi:hypothetical protein
VNIGADTILARTPVKRQQVVIAIATAIGFVLTVNLAGESTASAETIAPKPTERLLQYGKYRLNIGEGVPICDQLARGFEEYSLLPSRICALPIENNSEFSRPHFDNLNALENLDIFKQIYAWQSHGRDPKYKDRLDSESIATVTAAIDDIWKADSSSVLQKIKSRKFVLERSRFDLNNDGLEEVVYRMGVYTKNIYPLLRSKDGKIIYENRKSGLDSIPALDRYRAPDAKACQAPLIDGIGYLYHYFVLREDNASLGQSTEKVANISFDVFSYEKVTYLAYVYLGVGVVRSVPLSVFNKTGSPTQTKGLALGMPVCNFVFNPRE